MDPLQLSDLYEITKDESINIVEIFTPKSIKGIYTRLDNCKPAIGMNYQSISSETEEKLILAEEIGHYFTATSKPIGSKYYCNKLYSDRKEHRAFRKAVKMTISHRQIVKCMLSGANSLYELAEALEVTEDYLKNAFELYKQKYGQFKKVGEYYLYFDPIGVLRCFDE